MSRFVAIPPDARRAIIDAKEALFRAALESLLNSAPPTAGEPPPARRPRGTRATPSERGRLRAEPKSCEVLLSPRRRPFQRIRASII
jgi:hypothetical protein